MNLVTTNIYRNPFHPTSSNHKLGGLEKVQQDIKRRDRLGFRDDLTAEELGYALIFRR